MYIYVICIYTHSIDMGKYSKLKNNHILYMLRFKRLWTITKSPSPHAQCKNPSL